MAGARGASRLLRWQRGDWLEAASGLAVALRGGLLVNAGGGVRRTLAAAVSADTLEKFPSSRTVTAPPNCGAAAGREVKSRFGSAGARSSFAATGGRLPLPARRTRPAVTFVKEQLRKLALLDTSTAPPSCVAQGVEGGGRVRAPEHAARGGVLTSRGGRPQSGAGGRGCVWRRGGWGWLLLAARLVCGGVDDTQTLEVRVAIHLDGPGPLQERQAGRASDPPALRRTPPHGSVFAPRRPGEPENAKSASFPGEECPPFSRLCSPPTRAMSARASAGRRRGGAGGRAHLRCRRVAQQHIRRVAVASHEDPTPTLGRSTGRGGSSEVMQGMLQADNALRLLNKKALSPPGGGVGGGGSGHRGGKRQPAQEAHNA